MGSEMCIRDSIQSQRDVGTRVEIDLSFDVDQSYEAAARQTEQEERIDLTGVRVLLVEDNDLNAEIAQTMLEDEGAQVTVAENGKRAVERFQSSLPGTFDAILMDVMMPVMDGLTATRAIRAGENPLGQTIPILAMTANAFADDRQKTKDAGMNGHLAKPIDMDQLRLVLEKWL